MANVAINLKGEDNLSKTVKEAKNAVDDLKKSTTELGKCQKEFDKITNAGKPLKTQLRQIQALMADMNMKGLANTNEFTQIAMKAGEIKDAMQDAADAVTRFASDTQKLDATIQAVQGIAAGASIATGAMALFGKENEKVAQTILKVQSAMAILNGVQQIANLLNKDSALMQRIKAIRLAANTKLTVADTMATNMNNAAIKGNTVATVANTSAQKAWNLAKAIGKALFGDFTGLLLVGVAGMTAYAIATDNAEEEQKQLNDAVDEAAEKQKSYKQVMADTFANLMTQYTQLRAEWNKLSTAHEKNRWITENKNKLLDLGQAVNNVADAERVFNSNTNAVVQSFIQRAKAAARLAELTDLYREQMKLIDERNEKISAIGASSARNRTGVTAVAGGAIPHHAMEEARRTPYMVDNGRWTSNQKLIDQWNNGKGADAESVRKIDSQIEANNKQITQIANAIAEDVKARPKFNTSTPSKTTNTNTNNEIKFADGSLDALEKQLQDAKKRLTSGLFDKGETEASLKTLINDLEVQVKNKRVTLGLELSADQIKEAEIKKEVEKLNEKLKEVNVKYSPKISSFDEAIEESNAANGFTKTNEDRLNEIQKEMDYNDNLIEQLKELINLYSELGQTDSVKNLNKEIENLEQTQTKLKDEAKAYNQEIINFDKQREQMEQMQDAADNLGSSFSSLGQIFDAVGASGVAAVAQMVAVTIQGVADVVPQIMKLIAAKQAEAMASGTAGAAKLPFPANIGAIAAITATILSTFASIFSAAQKFEHGGIVGGSSMYGDKLLARVNSGEMILNGKQQKRLFDILDGGGAIGGNSMQNITWRIKGSDLYGSLSNYSKIKEKVGKKIL